MVEQRTPNPWVVGSNPSRPASNAGLLVGRPEDR